MNMNLSIKTMWHEFKYEEVERQFLFFYDENKWKKIHISKNETTQNGTLDLDVITEISTQLEGKSVIIVHNHVRSVPTPSFPDYSQYEYLYSLFSLLNIYIDDYIIVSPYGYVSFKENNRVHEKIFINQSYPYQSITFPSYTFAEDIFSHKEDILNHLKTNNELILSTPIHVASIGFSGHTLLNVSRALEGETLFFSLFQDTKEELERLKHIDRVLKPIELFVCQHDTLIPLKKNGIL